MILKILEISTVLKIVISFFKIKYVGLQIARLPVREMEHWPHERNTWEKQAERNINTLCPTYRDTIELGNTL